MIGSFRLTQIGEFQPTRIGVFRPTQFGEFHPTRTVKHPTLMTAWFYGTREHWLLEDVVALIRAVCRHLSLGIVDVVFYSSSSGGTAALSAAALIDGALAIAVNPQIRLTHWFH